MFNAQKEKDNIIQKIRTFFNENGPTCKAVVGVSGGKDSTIVATLCVEALGTDRVIPVSMPNGEQKDIQDTLRVIEILGLKNNFKLVNINNAYKGILEQLVLNGLTITRQTEMNLPPRLRMSTLYAIAQSCNGLVMNTSNRSEYMAGYFTRFGDECGDLKVLLPYTKTEVVKIGELLDMDPALIHKVPSDGLSDKSDEENLGFTYDELDKVIAGDIEGMPEDTYKRIVKRIEDTKFKR